MNFSDRARRLRPRRGVSSSAPRRGALACVVVSQHLRWLRLQTASRMTSPGWRKPRPSSGSASWPRTASWLHRNISLRFAACVLRWETRLPVSPPSSHCTTDGSQAFRCKRAAHLQRADAAQAQHDARADDCTWRSGVSPTWHGGRTATRFCCGGDALWPTEPPYRTSDAVKPAGSPDSWPCFFSVSLRPAFARRLADGARPKRPAARIRPVEATMICAARQASAQGRCRRARTARRASTRGRGADRVNGAARRSPGSWTSR